ncbi:MAG: hypothetical protein WCY34_06590 [Candidatus Omnitrophota bacterium]
MKFLKNRIINFIFPMVIFISGCATTPVEHILDLSANQLKLRSIQTRSFDTSDKERMMRSVIATLQDLEFVVNKADDELGIVTGTKFVGNQVLKITVIVRPKNDKQLLVRANAQLGIKSLDAPEPYQDFFDALSKAVFLTAQNID